MLVVKVEVHPGGDASRAHEIGELYIWNVSGLADTSDYEFSFFDPRPALAEGADRKDVVEGRVRGHKRAKGPWVLIRRVLAAANCAPCSEVKRRRMGLR